MATLSLRLPESLHRHLRDLAKEDGISINQFITTAVAEKLSSLATATYLAERAQRGDRGAFERILAKVPDVAPMADDELAEQSAQSGQSGPKR